MPNDRDERSMLSTIAALAAIGAFLLAAVAVIAVSTTGVSSDAEAGPPVAVTLTDYKISPNPIKVAKGGSLDVTNGASQIHNLAVRNQGLTTANLNGGASETLDVSSLNPGPYSVYCTIPGHEAAGMVADMEVVSGAAATELASASATQTGGAAHHDFAAAEKGQDENLKAYAENALTKGTGVPTEGRGNQKLEPRIGADGAKEFDLTAKVVQWEVEPGKKVEAWSYNGMVPGPWIRVEPGDLVRVNFTNELPEAGQDIHWHGISTPMAMDGVATLTQRLVMPGESFTYEFRAPAVPELGMYHAHMHGQVAVVNGMFAVFQVGDVDLSKVRGQEIFGRPGFTIPANIEVEQEVPFVLNDAGTIGLSINGKAYPAIDPVLAHVGKATMIHYYNEGLQAHPMHLHKVPQLVVARDGFALPEPYWVDTINVAPGERYSVMIFPQTTDLATDIDGNPDIDGAFAAATGGMNTGGVGVWAFHCHILTHAESDNGLFGMVTTLAVVPPEA